MKERLTWLGVVTLLFSAVAFGPSVGASTQAATSPDRHPPPHHNPLENIPITGTVVGGGTLRGTLDIVSFANDNGVLVVNGLLDGTLTTPTGTRSFTNEYVTLPANLTTSASGAPNVPRTHTPAPTGTPAPGGTPAPTPFPAGVCPILHLELGPLDLNLLGLVVHLDRVVLDITAVPGAGNLLGNLLCAIAHLLDQFPPPGPLDQIIGLLNRIIDLLGR